MKEWCRGRSRTGRDEMVTTTRSVELGAVKRLMMSRGGGCAEGVNQDLLARHLGSRFGGRIRPTRFRVGHEPPGYGSRSSVYLAVRWCQERV